MKNKELFAGSKGNIIVKVFKGTQYWIALVAYLIVVSLSIVCLASYLPDLSGAEVFESSTLIVMKTMLIIILIVSTGAFGWEMMQWRKGRSKKKEPSLEDIIKDYKKDTNQGDSN